MAKNKDPEIELIAHLRFKKYFYASDEVTIGSSRADILALDKNKRHIHEFEFKRSANDLKVLENKKKKNTGWSWGTLKPHKFYFVIPEKLWKKECAYLKEKSKEQGFEFVKDILARCLGSLAHWLWSLARRMV